ncbi:hypothetical protein RHGRI_015534 [Rhododendron griersonianum]|uniref:Leucine-rich repeat-containing N-terminal plant-type domain-containing protein n=1 Tax=Rhododendron griersonianum TaxID=479676 RepID=A0AAV6KDX2_9ERIC|nr:hypothetical protein RHGRI_015534 [Rhododendron griersonianum]
MRIQSVTWFFSIIITLTILCFIITPVHSQCLEDQKSLLLQLKNGLQFDPDSSAKLVNWTQSNDCCQWNGVTCDHFGRVIGLDLNTESISGGLNHSSSLFGLKFLQELNLAYNNFNSAQFPSSTGVVTIRVLNLQNNNLTGNITGTFPKCCALRTLDLSENLLEGHVPKSLANCANAEVLNLGINNIYGIHNNIWPNLQIIDLALNNFSGILPPKFFLQRKGMMDGTNAKSDRIHLLLVVEFQSVYYEDSVTITHKGSAMELVKILTIFTAIDFSNNNFKGEIPDTVGDLKSLYVLNLSHNSLTGSIPSSVGNLTQLGSLDLSWNKLDGSIPVTLARLTFLAVLNLSYDQLVGMIPRGPQLQTFLETSFIGNKGLWGAPLTPCCKEVEPTTPTVDGRQSNTDEDGIN